MEGRIRDVQKMLEAGANPNRPVPAAPSERFSAASEITPLMAAIRVIANTDTTPRLAARQAIRTMQALFDSGASLQFDERVLLLICVQQGQEDVLEFLVRNGANARKYQWELIQTSLANQRDNMVKALKSHGLDPNVSNQWGVTPFLELCSGNTRMKPRFDDEPDREDETSYAEYFAKLASHGVDLNARDRIGVTGLMRSIVSGQSRIAKALVLAGADVNAQLRNGVAAIHLAACCSSQDLVRLLLAKGASQDDLLRLTAKRIQPDAKSMIAGIRQARTRTAPPQGGTGART
jgi:ankyrin repeat protein